jgi:endonuclease/exonuclease/phosphatase (EEP) superfamily protein YafD
VGERDLKLIARSAGFVVVGVMVGLTGLGTTASFLGRLNPLFELLSNLRVQYLVLGAVAALLLLLFQSRRLALVAGVLALVNLLYVAPLYLAPPIPPGELATQRYRALLLNVHFRNQSFEEVIDLVQNTEPDLIIFLEATPEWVAALEPLRADYPYVESGGLQPHPGSIVWFSRIEPEAIDIQDFGVPERPVIVAKLKLDEQPLTVIGMHPYPFMAGAVFTAGKRLKQLEGLTEFLQRRTGPVMVLADFNFTPWSPLYQDLLRETGLRDTSRGFGLQPTFPAYYPPLYMPIDYGMVSPEIAVLDHTVGPLVGSDHFPVIVDFAISTQN